MPPFPTTRTRVQPSAYGPNGAQKTPQNVLSSRTGSSGGTRARRETNDVIPSLPKNETSSGEDPELYLTCSHMSGAYAQNSSDNSPSSIPKHSKDASPAWHAKPEILLTPPSKRPPRERRRLCKPGVNILSDGPRLQPNLSRSLTPRYNLEDDQISYAQAACYRPQVSSINVSPRSENGTYVTPQTSREASTELSSAPPSPIFDSSDDSSSGSEAQTHQSYNNSTTLDDRLDERLTDPETYFSSLRRMEGKVIEAANISILTKQQRQKYPRDRVWKLSFPFPQRRFLHGSFKHYINRDDVLANIQQNAKFGPASRTLVAETTNAQIEYWTFHALECRNVLLSIMSNIKMMRHNRYCQDFISVLCCDENRSNVVNLSKVDVDWIHGLFQTFETALSHMCSLLRNSTGAKADRLAELRDSLTQPCEQLLRVCSLPRNGTIVNKWRTAVMTLNLAVSSYAGAHQKRFDLEYVDESLDYSKLTPSWTYDTSSRDTVMMRYRRLRCLDGLLSSPVWVLQHSQAWEGNESLYVSSDIDTLSDIWGPIWAIKDSSSGDDVREYCFENGSLRLRKTSDNDPSLLSDEVMLHWSPPNPFIDTDARQRLDALGKISPKSRLLIGGGSLIEVTTSHLKETPACPSRRLRILEDLKARNLLSELGTSTERRYLAQEAYSAQIGYSGFTVGAQRMYKRQQGVTYKQAICAQWKHGSAERSPQIMERWVGVEISFCSGNARRRRLKDILCSSTMKEWLDNCISKDMPCQKAFRDALEDPDPRAFARLWKNHKEWRDDLRLLVSWCLEGLVHTKVDDEGSLSALWMPRPQRSYLVKVKQSKHAWTSFLEDSPIQCAFPVMSGKCLYSDYGSASICQAASSEKSAYSILETSIVINEHAPKPKGLEFCPPPADRSSDLSRYALKGVRLNDRIPVYAGRLRIRELFRNTRLLVEWEQGMARKIHDAVQSVSKTVGREALFHREHTDDKELSSKPIPVFIVSQNKNTRP